MLRRFLIVPALLAMLLIALVGSQAHAAVSSTPTRVDCSTPGVVSITVLGSSGLTTICYTGTGRVEPGGGYYSLSTGQWQVTAVVYTGIIVLDPLTTTIKLNPGQTWQAPSFLKRGKSFTIAYYSGPPL